MENNITFRLKNVKDWVPFFSQSGTEIMEIISYTGIIPKRIMTNLLPEESDKINKVLFERFSDIIFYLPNRPSVEEYETVLKDLEKPLITLHGWLRIIPKEICKNYNIYNGHPGLISKHPELKGKDPQLRSYMGNYETGGSVIHKVIPEVDQGKILISKECSLEGLDLDKVFLRLRDTSRLCWLEFFDSIEWIDEK